MQSRVKDGGEGRMDDVCELPEEAKATARLGWTEEWFRLGAHVVGGLVTYRHFTQCRELYAGK
jgi:hypothetical protein